MSRYHTIDRTFLVQQRDRILASLHIRRTELEHKVQQRTATLSEGDLWCSLRAVESALSTHVG